MKSFLQLFLLSLIIILGFFFYKNYFSTNHINEIAREDDTSKEKILVNPQENQSINSKKNIPQAKSNLIKNLKYKVKLADSGEYEINANLSELSYQDEAEIILMKEVIARFIDEKGKIITVKADKATFNNLTYNTEFEKNITIKYLNNIITAEKLNFDFKKSDILIRENIIYNGPYGFVKADNIIINIITKNIKAFMDNSDNKIEIKSN